jgi:heat shock protein HslJ
MVKRRVTLLFVFLCCVGAQGCGSASQAENNVMRMSDGVAAGKFAGTRWRLVEIQSMDDAIGTVRPDNPDLYTMDLSADGTVAMRLNCNRGRGQWTAKPVAKGGEGSFRIGPLAMTRAQCRPPSLDVRIAKEMDFVRSFIIRDGRLYLSLMADGGIYVWEPRANGN